MEWPRRPSWSHPAQILNKDWVDNHPETGLGTPIFDPFSHPSWFDNQVKQDRENFLKNKEFKEWFDNMPRILKQVALVMETFLSQPIHPNSHPNV